MQCFSILKLGLDKESMSRGSLPPSRQTLHRKVDFIPFICIRGSWNRPVKVRIAIDP